jgi:predicted ArsR family transcriptional regulator
METTRQHIVAYIKEHQVVTTAEISHRLNLTPADVRHHLSLLIKQGSVTVVGDRSTGQRGRPAQLYTLAMPMARNNLHLLSHELLIDLASHFSSEEWEYHLRQIAIQLSNQSIQTNNNPTQRIYLAINHLNSLNYDASWEAHANSPWIILGHCPYAAIIDQHPELCRLDIYLLENLLGLPVQLIEKLITTSRGLRRCIFVRQDQI